MGTYIERETLEAADYESLRLMAVDVADEMKRRNQLDLCLESAGYFLSVDLRRRTGFSPFTNLALIRQVRDLLKNALAS